MNYIWWCHRSPPPHMHSPPRRYATPCHPPPLNNSSTFTCVMTWRGVASLSSIPRRPQRRSMSRGSPKATARGGVNPAARGCCHLPVMPSRSRLALASRPVYTPPTPRRTLLSPAMLASGREAHAVRQSAPRRPAPYLFLSRVRSGQPAATVTCSGCTDHPPIDRLDRWYSLARAATRG